MKLSGSRSLEDFCQPLDSLLYKQKNTRYIKGSKQNKKEEDKMKDLHITRRHADILKAHGYRLETATVNETMGPDWKQIVWVHEVEIMQFTIKEV